MALHRGTFCQTKYVSLFAGTIKEHIFFSFLALLCSECSYHSLFLLSVGWSEGMGVAVGGGEKGDTLAAF